VLDLLVVDGYHIATLDIDTGAVGHEALEAAGPGERRLRPPSHRRSVPVRGHVEDLEAEVRERLEQLGEVLTNPVGCDQLLLADEPIDSTGGPAVDGGVEVMVGKRLEVSLGYI
jgi:hypothetical protein